MCINVCIVGHLLRPQPCARVRSGFNDKRKVVCKLCGSLEWGFQKAVSVYLLLRLSGGLGGGGMGVGIVICQEYLFKYVMFCLFDYLRVMICVGGHYCGRVCVCISIMSSGSRISIVLFITQ